MPSAVFSFVRTARLSVRRCGCAAIESRRSATQRAPVIRLTAAPIRWIEFGGDVVITASIPSLLTMRDRRRDRGQVPAHVLVRHEQAATEQPHLRREALEALGAVELVGGPLAARPDVLRAVHPRLRRRDELVVAVHPLRVVRREHVRLDPVGGQVRRELERALDAAAPGGREVERYEQDLHAASMVVGRGRRKMRMRFARSRRALAVVAHAEGGRDAERRLVLRTDVGDEVRRPDALERVGDGGAGGLGRDPEPTTRRARPSSRSRPRPARFRRCPRPRSGPRATPAKPLRSALEDGPRPEAVLGPVRDGVLDLAPGRVEPDAEAAVAVEVVRPHGPQDEPLGLDPHASSGTVVDVPPPRRSSRSRREARSRGGGHDRRS